MDDYYMKIGTARDLKNTKDRMFFRFLEILPGFLSWTTLITAVLMCWLKPYFAAIFIISFVLYWLFRTVYFSFYLRATYKKTEKQKKIDWIEKLNQLSRLRQGYGGQAIINNQLPIKTWKDIYHLIVLPMYGESYEILRETMRAIEKSDYPKDKMIIVLGCEQRAGEKPMETAQKIQQEFDNKFFKFLITQHPADLVGEIAGKGSNDAWTSRKAKELIIDPLKIPYENVIVSSLDADTVVFPKYFSCLTYHYKQLVDVNFRQANIISDDSRIFWQCFLKYNGDYRTIPLYYPVSMDANLAKTFLRTLKNIYKQQKRWAYGVGDFAYFVFGATKNKKVSFFKKLNFAFIMLEGHWSWATTSIIIFLLGWLPIVLGGEQFSQTLIAYNLPLFVRNILTLAMFGLISSAYLSILMLPTSPFGDKKQISKKRYPILVLQWLLLPMIMVIFTALPALDAQTRWMFGKYMGFWVTEKSRKKI
jgi:cellulose synthase/poly-beta-1,6-N-acetylglucosamine synthase-like glycosyltransferase